LANEEQQRLVEARHKHKDWKNWGPYISDRAWGTVREDYSADGAAWDYFPHDYARSKAYRWGEDGIAGISDSRQHLCFGLAFWNGVDPILKERPFGLSGPEGNHGEDLKEYYFFLDSTPTHSYMKMLYKYPQGEFPYADLVDTNRARGKEQPEYELLDTGVFDNDRYWDVFIEYAKADVDDILIRITVVNRGPESAKIDLLPTLWFRNTWSWGKDSRRPTITQTNSVAGTSVAVAEHPDDESRVLMCDGGPDLLFTENETNFQRLHDVPNQTPYVKDAFHEYIIHGNESAINPAHRGSKCAARYQLDVGPGRTASVRLRLTKTSDKDAFGPEFEKIFDSRIAESEDFYAVIGSSDLSADARLVLRQAFAGMLWSKQFYRYDVKRWLEGDLLKPPPQRLTGRNSQWRHLNAADIISMPDTWEYPWFAAWDLCFHCIPLAVVDPDFAKSQILLLLKEWYQHPSGKVPAYEWSFDDVNPPVHAWAAYRVYKIDRRVRMQQEHTAQEEHFGKGHAFKDDDRNPGDLAFLQRVFHKLLLSFTWWVNRKDVDDRNIFQGGFLGLDNIGIFDRSQPLPTGGKLEQADGTSWMAVFCLNMLSIALELSKYDRTYEDMAIKFFEHFVSIAHAMNNYLNEADDLFDEKDGFYYDMLDRPDAAGTGHERMFLKVRSMVGLIPLLAVDTMDDESCESLTELKKSIAWLTSHRPELVANVADISMPGMQNRRLLSVVDPDRLRTILAKMLDEEEFLSPHGLRALSRFHKDHPFIMEVRGVEYRVDYEPAESTTGLFGGNSNWRGPIWFPLNYLLIEALQRFDYYLGPDFKVAFPTGSNNLLSLKEVAAELSRRLTRTFLKDSDGRRPCYGATEKFQTDPHWRDLITFSEYFHGDNGAGLGASHQTGWTGLVAKLIEQSGE
jgi:hypothetical protein